MVRFGRFNSRVKDLWDVAALARYFAFDGEILRDAIAETFRCRGTEFGDERPEVFQPVFYEDPSRAIYWQNLQRQMKASNFGPVRLVDVGEEIRSFLGPVCDSLITGEPFTLVWPAGGPWQPGAYREEGGDRVVGST